MTHRCGARALSCRACTYAAPRRGRRAGSAWCRAAARTGCRGSRGAARTTRRGGCTLPPTHPAVSVRWRLSAVSETGGVSAPLRTDAGFAPCECQQGLRALLRNITRHDRPPLLFLAGFAAACDQAAAPLVAQSLITDLWNRPSSQQRGCQPMGSQGRHTHLQPIHRLSAASTRRPTSGGLSGTSPTRRVTGGDSTARRPAASCHQPTLSVTQRAPGVTNQLSASPSELLVSPTNSQRHPASSWCHQPALSVTQRAPGVTNQLSASPSELLVSPTSSQRHPASSWCHQPALSVTQRAPGVTNQLSASPTSCMASVVR
jgi:hypothetical protein